MFLQLTEGAEYRIRNAWSNKYAAPASQVSAAQIQHFTLASGDNKQIWVAELADQYTATDGRVVRSYFLKNKGTTLYWTNPASTTYGDPCTLLAKITGGPATRQWYRFEQHAAGVYFIKPGLPSTGYIQLSGPSLTEGQYIQLFPNSVGGSSELWLVEPVASPGTILAKPVIKGPIYSDHTSIFVENIEAGAGIQLYKSGQAYSFQRTNDTAITATLEAQVTGLQKGDSFTCDTFKTGRTANRADAVVVDEFAGIVQKTDTGGAITYQIEILKVSAGTNLNTIQAARFEPPKILFENISTLSVARTTLANAGYKKTEL